MIEIQSVIYKQTVNKNDLLKLEQMAEQSDWKRARICLHDHDSIEMHQMIIAVLKQSYIPPHRQVGSKKGYLILKGKLELMFFDDFGTHFKSEILCKDDSEIPLALMFDAGQYHTVQAISNVCIFLEARSSMWSSEAEFAPWAPDRNNTDLGRKFLSKLTTYVKEKGK